MINIIISVSKMELADKVAAVGLLVVVPDLLYGDYFSYDPQFDREGWLKKHGETRERFLSLRKGTKSEVANALEEGSSCMSYMFGTAYVHTQHLNIPFFELLNDWIEKITCVIASLLSSQIPERLLLASPMGSAHNRSTNESSSFESPDFDHTAIEEFAVERNPATTNVDRNSRSL
ncbi:uncharacterized protein LOC107623499 isoform X3 [Arachis ipaensis]|uniref:uncharacterized protein LOC107623499 isoform X3 n=1 Tax=Arachis ipaensis TaxID=130454 RepID=UPI0007AF43E0|nr:uncharacterized protein LOC107623499 isoform X3 [Arachis ipaensis]XP_020968763.1 uncharacterized protein LOC107623499 isoform X3 [Arachis ipaensis]XP_025681716.1 uncharacterized protein LOC112783140 isoform X3 [Arachis hypogaea]XP_025681717.1 uncharacterized protein LOC112783140 isoform X3 [Arachis hypogaea]QHN82634.1 ADP-ribosylation factor GTPase-activating protein [Arachis hypogaea]